jgi:hypothetical protein
LPRCKRQPFKLSYRKILLSKLDVIDSRFGSLAYAVQEPIAALGFIAGKLRSVGDVATQQISV